MGLRESDPSIGVLNGFHGPSGYPEWAQGFSSPPTALQAGLA